MRRMISTSLTFFFKFVVPALFVSCLGLGVLYIFTSSEWVSFQNYQEHGKLLLVFFSIVAVALICWFFTKLKKVEVDGTSLYVSNYRKVIEVPLADIEDISDAFYPEVAWVNFRRDTEFGKKFYSCRHLVGFLNFPFPLIR